MRRLLVIISFSFIWLSGYSQQINAEPPDHYRYFQLLYHTGTSWSRTKYLNEQFAQGYKAFEARLGIQSTGSELWQIYYRYPRYGLGVHYSDLVADKEDTIVGNPMSAFVFFSIPWARFKRFSVNSDLSVGLSYTSKFHDPLSNPFNDVIASRINLYFDFNVNVNYMMNNRIDVYLGYGLTHYSNGAIHRPQKGMNNWGLDLGLSYHFKEPAPNSEVDHRSDHPAVRPDFEEFELPDTLPGQELQLMCAVGIVDAHRLGNMTGKHYFTSTFNADYAIGFSPKNRITFGMDVLYDGSLEIEFKGIPTDEISTLDKMYLGSHMGYQMLIQRFTLLFNLGTYFVQHSYSRGFWFARAGGRIRVTDHLHTHLCIKTKNGIRSDWIEWGLAYSIRTG